MKMQVVGRPSVNMKLEEFLELVLMWHCNGNIPMNAKDTCVFIENDNFPDFLQCVKYWTGRLGYKMPPRNEIVKALHHLYEDDTKTA